MLAGLLIGMGIVLPGVSGGVIAVILNVYDKLIFAVNNFSENKKENSIFLAKMIVSLIVGAVISANLLTYFFDKYLVEMSYLFIGLVLGTVPMIVKTYKEKCDKSLNYVVLVFVMLTSILLTFINVLTNSRTLYPLPVPRLYASTPVSFNTFSIALICPLARSTTCM